MPCTSAPFIINCLIGADHNFLKRRECVLYSPGIVGRAVCTDLRIRLVLMMMWWELTHTQYLFCFSHCSSQFPFANYFIILRRMLWNGLGPLCKWIQALQLLTGRLRASQSTFQTLHFDTWNKDYDDANLMRWYSKALHTAWHMCSAHQREASSISWLPGAKGRSHPSLNS